MEALGLAQKLDLPSLVADATTTLAGIDERAGDPETAERALAEVVEQARRDGDAHAELRGRYLLGEPAPRARRPRRGPARPTTHGYAVAARRRAGRGRPTASRPG